MVLGLTFRAFFDEPDRLFRKATKEKGEVKW
jgi:hypothetical protein